jgi:predicted ATPase
VRRPWTFPPHAENGEIIAHLVGQYSARQALFRDALDIARRQKAKLFELSRTATLARLLARQGKRDEARAMLADIYGWFTESFDTADLKEAKAVLDELNA